MSSIALFFIFICARILITLGSLTQSPSFSSWLRTALGSNIKLLIYTWNGLMQWKGISHIFIYNFKYIKYTILLLLLLLLSFFEQVW